MLMTSDSKDFNEGKWEMTSLSLTKISFYSTLFMSNIFKKS